MTKYIISFGADAMDHIPDADMPEVSRAAHAACQEAIDAGVLCVAGGLTREPASIVAIDGTVADGEHPDAVSGFTIVDVPSRAEAIEWAAKIAAACRCPQEVRGVMPDPELDAMLREAASRRP